MNKLNRRHFFKISAVAGGGLMLSSNLFVSCAEEIAAEVIPTKLSPFVILNSDNTVTIFSPNPEIGQGIKTSMPMVVAEELDMPWANVLVEQGHNDPNNYPNQFAGGSLSIKRGWQLWRTAGAKIRQIVRQAAANKWEIDISETSTKDGFVINNNDKSKISYGELAADAALLELPEEVELKDVKDFKIIGTKAKNVDNAGIVTGKSLFGLDYYEEGMKYAMIIRPPGFSNKLISYDDSVAKNSGGIQDIFVIQDNKVAIVGNSTWEVMKAKELIDVQWEEHSDEESTDKHVAELNKMLESKGEVRRKDGNVDSAFRNAARVIEANFEAPFLAHNAMEPMNYFASVKEDSAKLVGPSQTPSRAQSVAAEITGLDPSKIEVQLTRMGGGFGRRLQADYVAEAVHVSKTIQAPVKVIWSREDDMGGGIYRPACHYKFKAAIDQNNQMTAYLVRGAGINMNSTVRENNFPAAAISNYQAESSVLKSTVTTGPWRAPVTNFLACAEQSFLDEVAHEIGVDPIDMRLQMLDKAEKDPVGELQYEPKRFKDVINLVKEKSNWSKTEEGIVQGFSVYYSHYTYVAEVADMRQVGDELKIEKVHCAVDCGIVVNKEGAQNQIQGGVIDGIGHAMYSKMSFKNGVAEQNNFNNYQLIRMKDAPPVDVYYVENDIEPTGLGEPSLPPAAATVANAMFRLTGKRVYKQPFNQYELLG